MNITKPTLIVSEAIAKANIARMVGTAKKNNLELTPHFKTHQSKGIGSWFKEAGVNSINVTSVSMAEYFVEDGWKNITIAFPLNILEISKIDKLASSVKLQLLITDEAQVVELNKAVSSTVSLLIEIDTNNSRSGVLPDDTKLIDDLIHLIDLGPHAFKGFYSHFGHTYKAKSPEEVKSIYTDSMGSLLGLKAHYASFKPTISIGDTPSCSVVDDFHELTSIHAGNFVFYDLTQAQIGVCKVEDIAIALACPVVSKVADRKEVIIYGGGVHLSKEVLFDRNLEQILYGKVVFIEESGFSKPIEGCFVRSISQEHGVVKLTDKVFEKVKIGDILGILPVHSCMTADVMAGYIDFTGKKIDHFKAKWPLL